MFSKILIANRGEIALRIIRACREMGIETVIVYSQADADTLPVALADEAVCIGEAAVRDSYLNVNNILSAAEITGAEAIHPGYGFLSENADFAESAEKSGVIFIGPSSRIIRMMGDKAEARKTAVSVGVPVIPGSGIIDKGDDLHSLAEKIGYPLLVKASAGGGGKGIRAVYSENELSAAVSQASAEAESAFGDGSVFLEKYLSSVRHVEIQVIADRFGNALSLGERDCSLQRNKQKVIEETPCPALSPETREKMEECALKLIRKVGYTGLGTVEFLLSPDGKFYFIEMNTRLQVEHPITEQRYGVDLVKWQIRTAAGVALNFTKDALSPMGSSIEIRINARNTGKISFLHIPGGFGVRFDSAISDGEVIKPYYDSMIGKLIVHAATREEAIRKADTALCETVIQGIETNISDQLSIIRSEGFRSGNYDTAYITRLDKERDNI